MPSQTIAQHPQVLSALRSQTQAPAGPAGPSAATMGPMPGMTTASSPPAMAGLSNPLQALLAMLPRFSGFQTPSPFTQPSAFNPFQAQIAAAPSMPPAPAAERPAGTPPSGGGIVPPGGFGLAQSQAQPGRRNPFLMPGR